MLDNRYEQASTGRAANKPVLIAALLIAASMMIAGMLMKPKLAKSDSVAAMSCKLAPSLNARRTANAVGGWRL